MRQVTYKYNVGNKVVFKEAFAASASLGLKELAGQHATIVECKDYSGPCYRLEGLSGFFKETCFADIKEASSYEN